MGAVHGDNLPDKAKQLRARAEEALRGHPADITGLSNDDIQSLVHELQVHQIELEMQNDELEKHNDELRDAQAEIERMRDQYADLYESAPVGYLTLNQDGIIEQVNRTCATMLATEVSDLLQQPFYRHVFPKDQDTFYLNFHQIMESRTPQSFDIRLISKIGPPFYAQISGNLVEDSETHTFLCRLVISDITEHRQAEAERRKSSILQAELRKEVELGTVRDQLVETIAHEFRTPLSIIMAASSTLIDFTERLSTEQQKQKATVIFAAGERLRILVENATLLLETRYNNLEQHFRHVDPIELCATSIAEAQKLTRTKQNLVFVHEGQIRRSYLDQNLLKQMLVQLLTNAILYSPDGATIELSLLGTDQDLIFRIKDEGIGIPPDAHRRLSEPFFRAPNVGVVTGLGLGLTIVQEIVKLHNGTINFDSQVNIGTTVTVTIPVRIG